MIHGFAARPKGAGRLSDSCYRRQTAMITWMNPMAIKSFSALQMHTPNPPLGLAYIAAPMKDLGLPYQAIDGTGEALDVVRPYSDRDDFMIQGLSCDEIAARIDPDAEDTRYVKWFVGRFYTSRRRPKPAESAHR